VAQLTRRAVLAIYTLVIVVPLLVVLTGAFKTRRELVESPLGLPTSPTLDNLERVFSTQSMGTAFLNSILVTGAAVLVTLFVASLAAFGLARVRGRWGWLVFGFLVLGMAVPAQTAIVPQYVLFRQLGLLNSLTGLVIAEVVVTLPVAVFILTGFMRTLPAELFEAASMDGASPWRTYRSVVLPLSRPSLAAAAIFLFVITWNDLLYPLLFISTPDKRTLPLVLLGFKGEFLTDYPVLFAGVLVASAPLVVVYVFLQRYFVAGLTAGSAR
jgi:raffinose/stachyose/melibiose transport system permease protein